MDNRNENPELAAAKAREATDDSLQDNAVINGGEDHLMREIYNDAIAQLMSAAMPVRIVINVKAITGTPPFTKNMIAQSIPDGIEVVVIRVIESLPDSGGCAYNVVLLNDKNVPIDCKQPIPIKEWHLVHYLQKALEISTND